MEQRMSFADNKTDQSDGLDSIMAKDPEVQDDKRPVSHLLVNAPELKDADGRTSKVRSCLGSFSTNQAWARLSQSRCKHWDDPELDMLEGFKTISFALGTFCLTAEFLMFTQTINSW